MQFESFHWLSHHELSSIIPCSTSIRVIFTRVVGRLDFTRSLGSGLRPSREVPSGEERGLLSRTAAGDRA